MNNKNKLRIVPLGGLGRIGKNMMVIETPDDMVIVDVGVLNKICNYISYKTK